MALNDSIKNIRSLIELAVKTRIKFRDIGGPDTNITKEAENLNIILRRLLQEASKPKGAFNRAGGPCRESLTTLCSTCRETLRDINSFLAALDTLQEVERTFAGTQTFAISQLSHEQRGALNTIADRFKARITDCNNGLLALLITASVDALGGAQEELNNTMGCDITKSLNELTGQLVTAGKTRLASVASAENESVLWEALRSALTSRSFSIILIDRFKIPMLAYVRALEKSSAYGDVIDTLTDVERVGNQIRQRYLNPLSRSHITGRSVSSPYPETASHSIASNEDLARFLLESQAASHVDNARDAIRAIYCTLCADYEPRYNSLLERDFTHAVKDENFSKKLLGLMDEMEKQVLYKLDGVNEVDQDLRRIRKAIAVKVQGMLDALEAIKKQSGSR